MSSAAAAIISPAIKKHTSTVIVAHGLGDSGAGWSWFAQEARRSGNFSQTKFIFPHAPQIPITCNGGMRMPGWYDIENIADVAGRSEDEAGILRSRTYFHKLISDEIAAGIPSSRIVLGGFSQGGAMSLLSGATCPSQLAGVFGLSCYLLLQKKFQSLAAADAPNAKTPIFMGHGTADNVVQYKWGKATFEQLKEWDYQVEFKTYEGLTHSADPEELQDLAQWLKARVPDLPEDEGAAKSGSL
jgi:predicted esterase